MRAFKRGIFLVVVSVAVLALAGCGSGGTATSGFDTQELNDNSAQIQTNANNAGLIFVGTITALGDAPGFWSGIATSTQAVTYTVDTVLKGAYTETSLTVGMIILEGSRQSSDAAGLDDTLFAVGGQQIVFASQNADYISLGDDYQGPLYIDVESNYGTIPYSAMNALAVEEMIANPTAAEVVASMQYKGYGEKTLTLTGSAADQTSWNNLLTECKGMSQTLSDLVSAIENSETYAVTVNLVRDEARVFADSWEGRKVDVLDMETFDLNGCNSKTSRCQIFAHILQEYWHAAVTGDDYEPSHASALQHENQVRSDLGKTTTMAGHFGMQQGGNNYMQTTYNGSTELVQILNGSNVGPVTVQHSPPVAPSVLAADGSVTCRITLTWTDNSNNEGGFVVERKGGAAPEWAPVGGDIAADATTWANTGDDGTGLIVDQEFCYRIRSFRVVDEERVYSSYSNEACATKT